MSCDLEKYFDRISHSWLLENIPMDKKILKQFLKAGFVEFGEFNSSSEGTPQGGVISPILSNMVLDGLEDILETDFYVARYADDFVVLGESKTSLEKEAVKRIKRFLLPRGVSLNMEKTCIAEISEGFDHLGFHFREYPDTARSKGTKKGIFLVKPSKRKVKEFRKKVRSLLKDHKKEPLYVVITKVNAYIRS